MRSTLVWGPLVLVLACGASHQSTGSGDGKHEASGDDAGSGGAPTTIKGNGGSAGRSGSGGSGGAAAGGKSSGGTSAMASGAAGGAGMSVAGSGGKAQAGTGGGAPLGGSGGAMGGASSSAGAGAIDGSWRVTELHGDAKYLSATVYAISGDGTYVSGTLTDGTVIRGVRWQDDVPTIFEAPSDWMYAYGMSISEDGTKVAGYANSLEDGFAFIWDETGTHELLGLDSSMQSGATSGAVAISGNGRVIVGTSTTDSLVTSPVRWTDGAIEVLPIPDGFRDVRLRSVSRDGSVIAGEGQMPYATGIRWTDAGAESYGMDSVTVNDVSADGLWVVGSESTVDVTTGARPTRAVRYGPSGTEYLPDPDGRGWNCAAQAVSGDGSIVIGTCGEPVGNVTYPYAFLFNPERGSVPLDTVLQAVGVDISAYYSFRIVDISSDGTTLLASYAGSGSAGAGLRIRIDGAFP